MGSIGPARTLTLSALLCRRLAGAGAAPQRAAAVGLGRRSPRRGACAIRYRTATAAGSIQGLVGGHDCRDRAIYRCGAGLRLLAQATRDIQSARGARALPAATVSCSARPHDARLPPSRLQAQADTAHGRTATSAGCRNRSPLPYIPLRRATCLFPHYVSGGHGHRYQAAALPLPGQG